MKKLLLLVIFLGTYSIAHPQSESIPDPLLVSINGVIDRQQSILGLCIIEYVVVNISDNPVLIYEPEQWAFLATMNGQTIIFSQREISTFNVHNITLNPHETLIINTNLNFFDLVDTYRFRTGKLIDTPTKVVFNASIGCLGSDKIYYSKQHEIILNPFEKNDQDAFDFIISKDYDPFKFTSLGVLNTFGINANLAESLILKYPESTFAELASLSLAYQKARESTGQAQQKVNVLQLLEKPLKSKYSFVRYLAEELKKNQ